LAHQAFEPASLPSSLFATYPRCRLDRLSLRSARSVLVLSCLVAGALVGCGEGERSSEDAGPEHRRPPTRAKPRLVPTRCPPALSNCRAASGRIVYVEAVDPDGDGDAHFVLAAREGVTGPGVTVVDVKRTLRPRPLPRPGDRLSAAGPVYRGSYGQRQIEAVELHVAR
jgi:hypothetical protein